jgi:hypothetical protein
VTEEGLRAVTYHSNARAPMTPPVERIVQHRLPGERPDERIMLADIRPS